jgi:glucan phosphoethanolaminetransferase (alkaline phosphatase superfamily)
MIYCLLFNSTVFIYHSNITKACLNCTLYHVQHPQKEGIYWHLRTFGLMLCWVYALFFILSCNRIIFCISLPLLFFSSAVITAAEFLQKAPAGDNTIINIFQASLDEVLSVMGWPVIAWGLFVALVCWAIMRRYLQYVTLRRHLVILPCLLIGLSVAISYASNSYLALDRLCPWDFHPYDYTALSVRYCKIKTDAVRLHEEKFNIASLRPLTWEKDDKNPLHVIVVIGESVRADHLGLNGYGRDTTPLLSQQKNLVYFRNVTACGTYTSFSVPCLMTRSTRWRMGPATKETSFVSIFRALGFKTYWVSEQTSFLRFTSPINSIAEEAEEKQFEDNVYSRKSNVIPNRFFNILAMQNGDMLAVFHMIGTHWNYEWRYPTEFRRYTPVCMSSLPDLCPKENLFNSYDNSILYMDSFLAHTIDLLKDKNAILVYTSDHGEYLGENGMYFHSQNTEDSELRHVPMLWWVSDTFKRLHPDVALQLEQKTAIPMDHRVIFHSILDCAGVVSGAVDKRQSLCN